MNSFKIIAHLLMFTYITILVQRYFHVFLRQIYIYINVDK